MHFVFGIIVFALQIINVSGINFSFLVILAQITLMFLM